MSKQYVDCPSHVVPQDLVALANQLPGKKPRGGQSSAGAGPSSSAGGREEAGLRPEDIRGFFILLKGLAKGSLLDMLKFTIEVMEAVVPHEDCYLERLDGYSFWLRDRIWRLLKV